jgi:hypothetical protein
VIVAVSVGTALLVAVIIFAVLILLAAFGKALS